MSKNSVLTSPIGFRHPRIVASKYKERPAMLDRAVTNLNGGHGASDRTEDPFQKIARLEAEVKKLREKLRTFMVRETNNGQTV